MSKPPTGPLDHDEDGSPLPVPAAESELGQLIQLLEYGRKRGYRFGPMIRIGSLVLQVADLRQTEGRGGPGAAPSDEDWLRANGYDGP